MKYMVMECHLSYAVVLDEAGRFLKVANMHYQVGQTVTDVIKMHAPEEAAQTKPGRKWIYSLAAMAACLVLFIGSFFYMGQLPYASVYMTINPEVRIDVNRSDVVVGLEGINRDGKDLIADYSYQRKDLDLVMDELVDLAIEMGYLHPGGQITLTLDAEDNEWVVTHGQTLTTHLNEHLTQDLSITIEVTGQDSAGQEIIIPIEGDSGYGESDYGQTAPSQTETTAPAPTDSGYDAPADSGLTDYDEPVYSEPAADEGQSDYEDSQSNYDGGHSNYGDGDSAYEEGN